MATPIIYTSDGKAEIEFSLLDSVTVELALSDEVEYYTYHIPLDVIEEFFLDAEAGSFKDGPGVSITEMTPNGVVELSLYTDGTDGKLGVTFVDESKYYIFNITLDEVEVSQSAVNEYATQVLDMLTAAAEEYIELPDFNVQAPEFHTDNIGLGGSPESSSVYGIMLFMILLMACFAILLY